MTITSSTCWPDDKDYLDGATELHVPSSAGLKAYWDADVLDVDGVPPGTIIAVTDAFKVRFRVELVGALWHCMCGEWCFDLKFTPIGPGTGFDLSARPGMDPEKFKLKDWKGCDGPCVEVEVTVPAGTVPGNDGVNACVGALYEVGAVFSLRCCDDARPILAGYEAIEEIEFF